MCERYRRCIRTGIDCVRGQIARRGMFRGSLLTEMARFGENLFHVKAQIFTLFIVL